MHFPWQAQYKRYVHQRCPGITFAGQVQYSRDMGQKRCKTHWYEAGSSAPDFPFLNDVSLICFVEVNSQLPYTTTTTTTTTTQHNTTLYQIKLFQTKLYNTIYTNYISLRYTTLHYTTLHHTVLPHATLRCTTRTATKTTAKTMLLYTRPH